MVGASGSGKSTFANLVLRLYDPQEGTILIDGQDISKETQESLHKKISYVSQDSSLFHRTILENIAYASPGCTIEAVKQACIRANAHEFIETMPQGYDTIVGEEGAKLSGGQRQRLSLARAFLKESKILIFDETTSALDPLNEVFVLNSLQEIMPGKTVILIAHRFSMLIDMDRILVFDGGRIVEDGPHSTLVRLNGIYSKLWLPQINQPQSVGAS